MPLVTYVFPNVCISKRKENKDKERKRKKKEKNVATRLSIIIRLLGNVKHVFNENNTKRISHYEHVRNT